MNASLQSLTYGGHFFMLESSNQHKLRRVAYFLSNKQPDVFS
jgi:hypothetical protein